MCDLKKKNIKNKSGCSVWVHFYCCVCVFIIVMRIHRLKDLFAFNRHTKALTILGLKWIELMPWRCYSIEKHKQQCIRVRNYEKDTEKTHTNSSNPRGNRRVGKWSLSNPISSSVEAIPSTSNFSQSYKAIYSGEHFHQRQYPLNSHCPLPPFSKLRTPRSQTPPEKKNNNSFGSQSHLMSPIKCKLYTTIKINFQNNLKWKNYGAFIRALFSFAHSTYTW